MIMALVFYVLTVVVQYGNMQILNVLLYVINHNW
jgi:hypothetical protein